MRMVPSSGKSTGRRRAICSGLQALVLIANDGLIAGLLNRNKLTTGNGNRWTRERVTSLRSHHKIPVYRSAENGAEPWLNLTRAAAYLGVSPKTLRLAAESDDIRAMQATVQTCIVHLLRHSLDFVSWKDRKPVAAALKHIYRAVDAAAGEAALTAFDEGVWGKRYPAIGQSWRRAWAEVIPFYAFPADVRRILYTTNAIEALNSKLRRAVRARGHFPSDQAATKLLFLVLNRSEKEWIMPPREWCMAKAQFAVLFGERFTRAMA